MKKFLALLLSLILLLASAPSLAESTEVYKEDGYSYTLLPDGTAMITAYDGSDLNPVVPSMLGGHTVTVIGPRAFSGERSLSSTTYSENNRCENLQSIVLPDTVTEIRSRAFSTCQGLASVTLPSNLQILGDGVFYLCTGLKTLRLPDSITSIGTNVFYSCNSLKEFILSPDHPTLTFEKNILFFKPEGRLLMYIGSADIHELSVPNGTRIIDPNAFVKCKNLRFITLPASMIGVDPGAFIDVPALMRILVDEKNPFYHSIDGVLFEGSTLLCYPMAKPGTEYTVPYGTKAIGYAAFFGCKLSSILLPDTVTTMLVQNDGFMNYSNAFTLCRDLQILTAPASIIYNADVFTDKPSHTALYTDPESEVAAWLAKIDEEFYPLEDFMRVAEDPQTQALIQSYSGKEGIRQVLLAQPDLSYEEAIKESPAADFGYTLLEDGTACITEYHGSSTRVSVPARLDDHPVTSIAASAFSFNTQITQLLLPEGLLSLDNAAFLNCINLQVAVLPSTLQKMGTNPFMYCRSLTHPILAVDHPVFTLEFSLLISKTEKRIISCLPGLCGSYCQLLSKDVTSIGSYAFASIPQLTTLFFPDTITEMEYPAIYDCPNVIIDAASGSYVQQYCRDNGLPLK